MKKIPPEISRYCFISTLPFLAGGRELKNRTKSVAKTFKTEVLGHTSSPPGHRPEGTIAAMPCRFVLGFQIPPSEETDGRKTLYYFRGMVKCAVAIAARVDQQGEVVYGSECRRLPQSIRVDPLSTPLNVNR